MLTLSEEIAEMFGELSLAETDGFDPISYAARCHVDRWKEYDEERRDRMEVDEAYARERREQWARANSKRKRKRRGEHLSNADRVKLADDIRAGKEVREVAREHGLAISTAERIGQLVLWDTEAA